jgi:UbiA prenyltransferase family
VEARSKLSDPLFENVPLVVDLDGTLLRTDLLLESALCLVKQKPWLVFVMPVWLLRGRAYLKHKIFQRVQIDASLLPSHGELLAWLRDEKARGRHLVLATASDHHQARLAVEPLGLFDTVLGSDGRRNLKGGKKLATIAELYGKQFDYVGNSSSDLAIWRGCRHAILVNTSRRVERSARRSGNVVRVFPRSLTHFREALRSMRFYQWAKNLLLFVPAIASGTILDVSVAANAILAFVSFGLAASAAYILNDLLDLEEDRRHPNKKQRPFASGQASIGSGILLALASLSASAVIATQVPPAFVSILVAYLMLTCLYSLVLKRLLVVDVLTLALLYTLRVVAGSAATGIVLSPWLLLLSFGFFLFMSLAFSKRVGE